MIKILSAVVFALILFLGQIPTAEVSANHLPISIYVNEKEISTGVNPFIEKGTTFVPVRAICNALNISDISWNGDEKAVTIKGQNQIQFTVGEKYAFINGKKYILEAPTVIRSDRTMIPLRMLAETFGADVLWDSTFYTVEIEKDGVVVPSESLASYRTKDDLVWLSRIVEAESAGEPVAGQIAVANVVLNRVESNEYPNTIYGVIFDRKYGVQFQPAANGTVYNTPSKMCVFSAKMALEGNNNIENCLYFLNKSIATNMWIVNNRQYYTTINNHSFYL